VFVVLALLPADLLCFFCILEINMIMFGVIIKLLKYLKNVTLLSKLSLMLFEFFLLIINMCSKVLHVT
jgi:hypothetical protein